MTAKTVASGLVNVKKLAAHTFLLLTMEEQMLACSEVNGTEKEHVMNNIPYNFSFTNVGRPSHLIHTLPPTNHMTNMK